jgi:NDP-sugar pyrophosphorylase family protein
MLALTDFIRNFSTSFLPCDSLQPWEIVDGLEGLLEKKLHELGDDYTFQNGMAIHKTAIIEAGAVLKGSIVVSEHCFIGAHAYIRGPVFLGKNVKIGPGVEVKQSLIFDGTALAHFNYVGNSIIGEEVNFEAGSVCANHFNERTDKTIFVKYKDQVVNTQTQKFGALVGDGSKIGANAVLSPGTLLEQYSIVKRLALIEQVVFPGEG